MGPIGAKSLTPIFTNESQVKHQKVLYFLFSFVPRIWKPIFRLLPLSHPYYWLLSDSSRGFVRVNLFSFKNRFRVGTRAKNIRWKRRAIRKHQGPIGSKKKKALTIKKKNNNNNKKKKIFCINLHIIREVARRNLPIRAM